MKTQFLGPGGGEAKQIKILNRIVTWEGHRGIIYEADPRHVEIIINQLGLKDAKPIITPGTKEAGRTQANEDVELNSEDASKYRA